MRARLAVAWWLIPYANYVMPPVMVRALRRGPFGDPGSQAARSGEWIVWVWWLLYRAGTIVGLIGMAWIWPRFIASSAGADEAQARELFASSFRFITIYLGISMIGQALAAVPAIAIVGQIQRRFDAMQMPSVPPRPDLRLRERPDPSTL